MAPAIQKTKKGYNYTYVPLEDIQAKITSGMNKYGLTLYPTVVNGSAKVTPYSYVKTRFDKNGVKLEETINEFLYTADTVWHCINNDNPSEHLEIPWFAAANMQDASQTVNSANTYQARGFISAFFQLAMTETDPEAYRSKQKQTEDAEDKLVAKEIIDTVNSLVVAGLAKSPEKRDEVAELVKKRARLNGKPSPNYFDITKSDAASALLIDIERLFGYENKATEKESK